MAETDFLCSNFSTQVGEPLPGTATYAQVWFLLEYNGTWESKAFEASTISNQVKNLVTAILQQLPAAKLLLIRSSSSRMINLPPQSPASIRQGAGIAFYTVLVNETRSLLYRFRLYSYEELLEMDLVGLAHGYPVYDIHQTDDKLFLVCTHGRRDRCCARAGSLIFESMYSKAARMGLTENIWQCSHVGGHRFAANVLCFPDGIFYGRVGIEDIDPVMSTYRAGEFYSAKARGRSCLEGPVQAAEIFLRQITGLNGLYDFAPAQTNQIEDGVWRVSFQLQTGGQGYKLLIAKKTANQSVYKSCTSAEKTPLEIFELLELQQNVL
jgi:hypothetical protein